MPHEARVRSWLARRISPDEADELIQDAYCRLAMLDDVSHIETPDAYFFSIVRNLLVRKLKRQRVVQIDFVAEIESFRDVHPSPEDIAASRQDYARVLAIIANLPERCRRAVQLRKIEGWSQKAIAEHLGASEKAVEKQIWLGVRAIRAAWAGSGHQSANEAASGPSWGRSNE